MGPGTHPPYILAARLMAAPLALLQEMLAIMKSIYDMMGRHTYPILREDAPLEHVERFFQVSAPALGLEGQGSRRREGLLLLGRPEQATPPSEPHSPPHKEGKLASPTWPVVRVPTPRSTEPHLGASQGL